MKKPGQQKNAFVPEDALVTSKVRRSVPFEFVLDALTPLEPRTHPMFGCLAVYVGEKIVLMLRNKATEMQDNGVWIATTEEHHASLRREVPKMRSIQLFGGKISGWQGLACDGPDLETAGFGASGIWMPQDHTLLSRLEKDKQDARIAGSSPITSSSPRRQLHRCTPPRRYGDPARHFRAPAVADLR